VKRNLVFLLTLLPYAAGAAAAAELPRGTLIEKVVCESQRDQTYALYLPSTYTPERKWPILYAFDARGQGKTVAELFRRAAERARWQAFAVLVEVNHRSLGSLDRPAALRRPLLALALWDR